MGFTIFTSSGSFIPSKYGLYSGDVIHVKCVGGGGAGGGAYRDSYAGSAGGASSFGSVLSAAGGLAGITSSTARPTAQIGSCQGSGAGQSTLPKGSSSYDAYYGGCGGHGWLPGVSMPTVAGCVLSQVPVNIAAVSSSALSMYPMQSATPGYFSCFGNYSAMTYGGSMTGQYSAQTGYFGGYGSIGSESNSYFIAGAGGVGYGAGGGGAVYSSSGSCGSGGNGGVVTDIDYILTSADSIAVTVGSGGAGYGSSTFSGGGGARGCVAVWW